MARKFDNQSLIETSLDEISDDLHYNRISKYEAEKRERVLLESFEDNIIPQYLITRDIVRKLRQKLRDAFLYSFDCDHISTARSEKKFSCGYKNLQILFSSLLKSDTYRAQLQNVVTRVPTIWKIQSLFEEAWSRGFDPNGAATFDHKIHDSKKKIGVCDMAFLLASLRIRCRISDYSHVQTKNYVKKKMMNDIERHFNFLSQNSGSQRRVCFPLIFQSERHSKAMIGVKKAFSEANSEMVIIEPSIPKYKMESLLNNEFPPLQLLQDMNNERFDKYQILSVVGVIDTPEDFKMKTQLDLEIVD